MKPYIGITDFMSHEHADYMLGILRGSHAGYQRMLMVGLMVSRNTLNGVPTIFTNAFPTIEAIPHIFSDDPLAFNCIHYADYKGVDVYDNLAKVIRVGGPLLHSIQLDMTWPSSDLIIRLRNEYPHIKFILQVGKKAFQQVRNSPEGLLGRLALYQDSLSYILLDRSMGRGVHMDPTDLRPFVAELYEHRPDLGVVVAGGLGPSTLNLVTPLVSEFPGLSIDAQGQLRLSGSALDPIDWGMAKEYLLKATQLFS